MNKTARIYINGISAFCKTRKFSKEGMCGYLENVLFQLKRKLAKQKEQLTITAAEIVGVEELLAKTEAEWAAEERQLESAREDD